MELSDWEAELKMEGTESKVEKSSCSDGEEGKLEGAGGADEPQCRLRSRGASRPQVVHGCFPEHEVMEPPLFRGFSPEDVSIRSGLLQGRCQSGAAVSILGLLQYAALFGRKMVPGYLKRREPRVPE